MTRITDSVAFRPQRTDQYRKQEKVSQPRNRQRPELLGEKTKNNMSRLTTEF